MKQYGLTRKSLGKNEPLYHKTNKLTCAPCKDSDQPVQSTSLIQSLLYAQWIARDHRLLHSNSDGSDKLGGYPGLFEFSRATHDFVCLVSCSGSNSKIP